MQRFIKSFVAISALSTLAIGSIVVSGGSARADEMKNGTDASYVGAGVSAGVTNGGQQGDAATFGGNIAARAKLGETPFSARAILMFSDETTAIVPHVTADIPLARGTNAFVGAGYQIVEDNGKPTPNGNDDGVAVVAGLESQVSKNVILYGNTTVGIGTYQQSDAPSASFNAGVGFRMY